MSLFDLAVTLARADAERLKAAQRGASIGEQAAVFRQVADEDNAGAMDKYHRRGTVDRFGVWHAPTDKTPCTGRCLENCDGGCGRPCAKANGHAQRCDCHFHDEICATLAKARLARAQLERAVEIVAGVFANRWRQEHYGVIAPREWVLDCTRNALGALLGQGASVDGLRVEAGEPVTDEQFANEGRIR